MKHIFDDADKNKYEAYTKEEVLEVIQEAISSGELPEEINGLVLTFKNPVDNEGYKIAFCTQAKYNELEAGGQLEANCLYYITDDTTLDDIENTLDTLQEIVDDLDISNKVDKEVVSGKYTTTITHNNGNIDIKSYFKDGASYNANREIYISGDSDMDIISKTTDDDVVYQTRLSIGRDGIYISRYKNNEGSVVYDEELNLFRHLYRHDLVLTSGGTSVYLSLYLSTSTQLNDTTLKAAMGNQVPISATGYCYRGYDSTTYPLYSIANGSASYPDKYHISFLDGNATSGLDFNTFTITDTVTQVY